MADDGGTGGIGGIRGIGVRHHIDLLLLLTAAPSCYLPLGYKAGM